MKLFSFFIAASALFTATAVPMQRLEGNSSVSRPNRIPKIILGDRNIYASDKTAAENLMVDHYKGLKPENEQKQARLAFARNGWTDGTRPDDQHKQYLDFNYHRGEYPNSATIGQTVTLSRDRPPPELHFPNIPGEHKPEMTKEIQKKYSALPPDQARLVRSMKISGDWGEGSGLREETKLTYHHGSTPRAYNTIGDPVTVYRPMSFHMDSAVPEREIPDIKKRIRQEHENLAENHPLKTANYGVVKKGWHMDAAANGQMVDAKMYKVKDQLSDESDLDFERIGDFHVPMRGEPETAAASSSTGSKRKRVGSTSP